MRTPAHRFAIILFHYERQTQLNVLALKQQPRMSRSAPLPSCTSSRQQHRTAWRTQPHSPTRPVCDLSGAECRPRTRSPPSPTRRSQGQSLRWPTAYTVADLAAQPAPPGVWPVRRTVPPMHVQTASPDAPLAGAKPVAHTVAEPAP